MKVRNLEACQKQIRTKMAAVNKRLKFVILQQVNIISLLSIFKNENFTYELSNSGKHFIRLIGFHWSIWSMLWKSPSLLF